MATGRGASKPQGLYLPAMHAGQERVYSEFARATHGWLCAGRRWRKTSGPGFRRMVEDVLTTGKEFVWAAPIYEQVRIGWAEFKRVDPSGALIEFNEGRMEARFPGGGVVHFIALENYDKKRGYTSWGTVIDEGSEVPGPAYYEVVRHFVTGTGGWTLVQGTPKGRNWFWAEWEKAAERSPAHVAWQIPSYGCRVDQATGRLLRAPHPYENPELTMAEMAELYEQLGERRFRQEVLAEFLDDAGGVFRNVRACIRGQLEDGPSHPQRRYVVGVDLAKYQDYTVCVVVDVAAAHVVAFERYNRADWPVQCQRIHDLAAKWNDATVYIDSTGVGDPPTDFLSRAGVRVSPYKIASNAAKKALVEYAVLLVEQGRISFPDVPALVGELVAYEYQRTPGGQLTMNAPAGTHDDCVIAFALACQGVQGAQSTLAGWGTEWLQSFAKPASEINGIRLLRRTL